MDDQKLLKKISSEKSIYRKVAQRFYDKRTHRALYKAVSSHDNANEIVQYENVVDFIAYALAKSYSVPCLETVNADVSFRASELKYLNDNLFDQAYVSGVQGKLFEKGMPSIDEWMLQEGKSALDKFVCLSGHMFLFVAKAIDLAVQSGKPIKIPELEC